MTYSFHLLRRFFRYLHFCIFVAGSVSYAKLYRLTQDYLMSVLYSLIFTRHGHGTRRLLLSLVSVLHMLCYSYTMGCLPVRGDNPRALASGLSYVQVDKHGITILYHLHLCRPCT